MAASEGRAVPPAASPVPGDVRTLRQLGNVPKVYLNLTPSGHCADERRPLRHTDARGRSYTYALRPLEYSVGLILVLELLERFSFYGLYMTQTNYLTGSYDEDWNAGLTSMEAASLISLSTAVVYTVPFLGGMLADQYLGDYKTILAGILFFYLPGLFIIASSTVPGLLLGTHSFNLGAYKVALLVLWPVGAGTVKAVVNIFGARQHHPIVQRTLVESFYVVFYMTINVGAVAGCLVIPIVARTNVTVAYALPFVLLLVAVLCFVAGSKRYVHAVPGRDSPAKPSMADAESNALDEDTSKFSDVARVCALIVPFNIVYSQCPTTFMVQGAVMEPFLGYIEAPSMNNFDSISVLIFGYFVSSYLYPFFARNDIKMATGHKFAVGMLFGAASVVWSLLVEHLIHAEYARSGGRVNVLWQAPSYVFIGMGEIFSISTAYEVAFTASPPDKKVLACAFNLFCIGGMPNMLSLGLYRLCQHWFEDNRGSGNINKIESYAEAHVARYFWVLLGIVVLGCVVNLLPPVRAWITMVENKAAKASSVSTPKYEERSAGDETDSLLKTQQHVKYLEEGDGDAHIYSTSTTKAEFA